MPKLYEYFGLIFLFYSNEHEPIHVHGKFQDTESKAEIVFESTMKFSLPIFQPRANEGNRLYFSVK